MRAILLPGIPTSGYDSDSQVDPLGNVWSTAPFAGYSGQITKYDSSGTPLVSVPEGYYPYGLAVIGIDGPAPSPTLAPDPGDYYSFALTAARVRRWYSGP